MIVLGVASVSDIRIVIRIYSVAGKRENALGELR